MGLSASSAISNIVVRIGRLELASSFDEINYGNNYENFSSAPEEITEIESNNHSNNQTNNLIVDNKTQKIQLQENINKEYPIKFVLINSIFLLVFNLIIIIGERTQPNCFSFEDINVISYRLLLFAFFIHLVHSIITYCSNNF